MLEASMDSSGDWSDGFESTGFMDGSSLASAI
jgi:hypothetical protein